MYNILTDTALTALRSYHLIKVLNSRPLHNYQLSILQGRQIYVKLKTIPASQQLENNTQESYLHTLVTRLKQWKDAREK